MDTIRGVWIRVMGESDMKPFAVLAATNDRAPWPGIGDMIALPNGQRLWVRGRSYYYGADGLAGIVFTCERV